MSETKQIPGMTREVLFKVRDSSATLLQPEDSAVLQKLLETCVDYFDLVYGFPPSDSESQELLVDKPPAKTLEDKFLIGLWEADQKLIAVLDIVRDYPASREWFVGLLLIDPKYRRHGLGRAIYQACEGWAMQQGAQHIGLGVIEQNEHAYLFWQQLGFMEQSRRPPRRYGNKEHVVIVMKQSLSGNHK